MPTSEIISVCVIIFSLILVRVGGYTCDQSTCQPGGPTISFPFYLNTQNKRCGYSGFQLSCDHLNRTTIHLEQSGDFIVDYINYDLQTLLVRDPDGCLPRRQPSLSLGGSPFSAMYFLNFTFLKCSREVLSSLEDFSIIWCLSDALNIVAATTADLFKGPYVSMDNCSMWTANVPVVSPQSISVSQSMWLKWDMEFCRICRSKGGRCRLKGYSASVLECYGSRQGLSRGSKCAILVGVVMPWLLFIGVVTFYLNSKANRPINVRGLPLPNPPPPTDVANIEEGVRLAMTRGILGTSVSITRGIDSPTLESYPKTRLDEDGVVPRPDHDVCAICLSEYQGRETIRTLPDCSHYFHASCIDPWLKKNGACPICRAQKT